MAKLTKSQEFANAWRAAIRADETEDRWAAFVERKARYEGKVLQAQVLWFDRSAGEGAVRVLDTQLPIYACNIAGKKTWYENTACVYYEKGQHIQVTLSLFIDRTFVNGITPGIIDQEKWDSLDQSKLAFKVKDDGSTMGYLRPAQRMGFSYE